MGNDGVTVVVVGSAPLPETDLSTLSRARTVIGPESLVTAVRHLCPPMTEMVVGFPGRVADDAQRPVVVLRPAHGSPGESA